MTKLGEKRNVSIPLEEDRPLYDNQQVGSSAVMALRAIAALQDIEAGRVKPKAAARLALRQLGLLP